MHTNATYFNHFCCKKNVDKGKYLLFSNKLYVFITVLLSLTLKYSNCESSLQYNGNNNNQLNSNPYNSIGVDINDNSLSQIGRNLDRAILPNLISVGNLIDGGIQNPSTVPRIPNTVIPSIPGIDGKIGVPDTPTSPGMGGVGLPGIPITSPGIGGVGVPGIPTTPGIGGVGVPGIPITSPGIGGVGVPGIPITSPGMGGVGLPGIPITSPGMGGVGLPGIPITSPGMGGVGVPGIPTTPGIGGVGVPGIPTTPGMGGVGVPGIPITSPGMGGVGVPGIPITSPGMGGVRVPGIPTTTPGIGGVGIPGISKTIPGVSEISEEIGTDIGDIGNGIGAAIVEIGNNIEDGLNLNIMENSVNYSVPDNNNVDYNRKDDNLYTLSATGKGGSKIYTYKRPNIVDNNSVKENYFGRQPYSHKSSIFNSLSKDTNQISQKFPLYLNKSPLVITSTSNTGTNVNSSTNTSFNYSNGLNQIGLTSLTKQEINKDFSPYSSIHYLKTSTPQVGEKQQSMWKWEHIDKPLLRTNTIRPIEFKHKIPTSINEAWWNNYNIRKESKKIEGNSDNNNNNNKMVMVNNGTEQSKDNNPQIESQNDYSNIHKSDIIGYNQDNNHSHTHKNSHNRNHNYNHSHKQNYQNHNNAGIQHKNDKEKDHIHKYNDNIQEINENFEEDILRTAKIGDIVNLTRLEIPNPYDRKTAINNLISNSLLNMKQENWSIPVEEIINATFINPGTKQPDLVPNQMGPKVKVQDFYCNPNIHKCTDLYTVGTSIGEPLWKIYNTSTIGRAQRRIENLLDDTEVSLKK
ncbi:hypothetical protein FG379_000179 [Cryptosporidium bovis]|uniref:uncharacterized protein n=1 Tax=Cryptosporidium bovis TaxID=310047 RepID=UPI00351A8753|nr:hypothetical protein FG379_000179 [Cryptosporidium bovis]